MEIERDGYVAGSLTLYTDRERRHSSSSDSSLGYPAGPPAILVLGLGRLCRQRSYHTPQQYHMMSYDVTDRP